MPAKHSGEIKTKIIHQSQKNGDIYVLERKTVYDPDKQYNKVLSSRLIGKIPKGEKDPVPTRPKRNKTVKSEKESEIVLTKRVPVGMMDIIDRIGKVSGIDDAVYLSADTGTAQKIISLARYLLAANGQSLSGIQTWQYNHRLPYEDGIFEDVYQNLFIQVGRDENLQRNFFQKRRGSLSGKDVLAYDTSAVSVYAENQNDSKSCFNKSRDSLKTIKMLILYSGDTRQPAAFARQSACLEDVTSAVSAIKQLSDLNVNTAETVTDSGYYPEQNISELLQTGFDFITRADISLAWIRREIDSYREELDDFRTLCPFDHNTHGVTVTLMHDFKKISKYSRNKRGSEKSSKEECSYKCKIYLHIYFSHSRHDDDKTSLQSDLNELKTLLESGISASELTPSAQEKLSRYFTLGKQGCKITAAANSRAIKNTARYHGYFALVSSREKDTFECLRKYRKKESIESFFESGRDTGAGMRDTDYLTGRMFVQFVSLCYFEYFSEEILRIRKVLDSEISSGKLKGKELKTAKQLRTWIGKTPLHQQLQWFDANGQTEISDKLRSRRWNTETALCDALYLEKIGLHHN
jgi:hypothetical protein